jgi:hypothetical protein
LAYGFLGSPDRLLAGVSSTVRLLFRLRSYPVLHDEQPEAAGVLTTRKKRLPSLMTGVL